MAVQFTKLSVSPEVVQTTGTSETAVMSQKAVTDALASAGGGSSGGSGSTPVTLTFNKTIIYSSTSIPSNSDGTGILNKTSFPYTTNGSIQLTEDEFNTIQYNLAQHKRVLFTVAGNTYEGFLKKIAYGSLYEIEIIAFNTHTIALRLTIDSTKAVKLYLYRGSSKQGLDMKLETITLV